MSAQFAAFRSIVALALGAGIAVGAVGLFLINQIFTKRRSLMLLERENRLERLETDISQLRDEVERLRKFENGKRRRNVRQYAKSTSGDSDAETDLFTAVDTEEGDDEFFDFSEEETDTETSRRPDDPKLCQIFDDVDRLLEGALEDRQAAYDMLKECYSEYPYNADLLWRFAKACHFLASALEESTSSEAKKNLIFEGCKYAEKAVQVDPLCPEAHKWYAVTVGARGEFSGVREKINDGFTFKKHLDEALRLKPDDPVLLHLQGRFNYEVASLPWIERCVAKAVLGGVPEATMDKALKCFTRAYELGRKPWKENLLFAAKCCVAQDDIKTAVDWLEKASLIEIVTPDDEAAEEEIKELLNKYPEYCRVRSN